MKDRIYTILYAVSTYETSDVRLILQQRSMSASKLVTYKREGENILYFVKNETFTKFFKINGIFDSLALRDKALLKYLTNKDHGL